MQGLSLYNTLTQQKEKFTPIAPPWVGVYLCGPTVYGPPHLGHARSALTVDVLVRYLRYSGYKVKYVRNITDVGHLERDSDTGEDKMVQQAQLEQLDPMTIATRYAHIYHSMLDEMHILRPDIEPRATGHIIEQISLIKRLLAKGFAYESNGSVYFDVLHYHQIHQNYGCLSRRVIEDLLSGTRTLAGQTEKRNPLDFSLWKSAPSQHIMRWPSPWGEGFPGWHLECSAMSHKYLGEHFDIHAGGMDLCFPHHDCEIAQSRAAYNQTPAHYWLHNNMVTIAGQKMGKSLGNAIDLGALFTGNHPLLDQAYNPMTLRYFMLQAHYRSVLNFSVEPLKAAHKGYLKLMNAYNAARALEVPQKEESKTPDSVSEISQQLRASCARCVQHMNDDLNTAKLLAELFNLAKPINELYQRTRDIHQLGVDTIRLLRETFIDFVDCLGLVTPKSPADSGILQALLQYYQEAKSRQDYATVDHLRTLFQQNGLCIQDLRHGPVWRYDF